MEKLRIALDWTANTNHTGFYVAQQKGFYKNAGLEVEILTPDQDNYAITPAKKVEIGKAEFALCPFESVISYRTKKNPFDAVALGTIFKEDISAIAVLSNSGIRCPRDLDGKLYASYKARYEDEIVRQMIRNDDGEGAIEISYPKKLGIWNSILEKKADATWIFTNWEGIRAKEEGIQLRHFKMADYGIPYGYSPVIMASKRAVIENLNAFKNFLTTTKMGYLYAKENPKEVIAYIKPYVAEQDKNINLLKSQKYTGQFYGDEQNWGNMEKENVNLFLNWLKSKELINAEINYADLVHQFKD